MKKRMILSGVLMATVIMMTSGAVVGNEHESVAENGKQMAAVRTSAGMGLSDPANEWALVLTRPVMQKNEGEESPYVLPGFGYSYAVDTDAEGNTVMKFRPVQWLDRSALKNQMPTNPIVTLHIPRRETGLPPALSLPCKANDLALMEVSLNSSGNLQANRQWFIPAEQGTNASVEISDTELSGFKVVLDLRKRVAPADKLRTFSDAVDRGEGVSLVLVLEILRNFDEGLTQEQKSEVVRILTKCSKTEATPAYVSRFIVSFVEALPKEAERKP